MRVNGLGTKTATSSAAGCLRFFHRHSYSKLMLCKILNLSMVDEVGVSPPDYSQASSALKTKVQILAKSQRAQWHSRLDAKAVVWDAPLSSSQLSAQSAAAQSAQSSPHAPSPQGQLF